eukprot:GHVT01082929.1.p1 GENE.GHVT01082929.1~~GHVT01082929.1.p1  ORF type:complete len:746 (-),score=36.45 GHVT01082929.1:3598-5835(-)
MGRSKGILGMNSKWIYSYATMFAPFTKRLLLVHSRLILYAIDTRQIQTQMAQCDCNTATVSDSTSHYKVPTDGSALLGGELSSETSASSLSGCSPDENRTMGASLGGGKNPHATNRLPLCGVGQMSASCSTKKSPWSQVFGEKCLSRIVARRLHCRCRLAASLLILLWYVLELSYSGSFLEFQRHYKNEYLKCPPGLFEAKKRHTVAYINLMGVTLFWGSNAQKAEAYNPPGRLLPLQPNKVHDPSSKKTTLVQDSLHRNEDYGKTSSYFEGVPPILATRKPHVFIAIPKTDETQGNNASTTPTRLQTGVCDLIISLPGSAYPSKRLDEESQASSTEIFEWYRHEAEYQGVVDKVFIFTPYLDSIVLRRRFLARPFERVSDGTLRMAGLYASAIMPVMTLAARDPDCRRVRLHFVGTCHGGVWLRSMLTVDRRVWHAPELLKYFFQVQKFHKILQGSGNIIPPDSTFGKVPASSMTSEPLAEEADEPSIVAQSLVLQSDTVDGTRVAGREMSGACANITPAQGTNEGTPLGDTTQDPVTLKESLNSPTKLSGSPEILAPKPKRRLEENITLSPSTCREPDSPELSPSTIPSPDADQTDCGDTDDLVTSQAAPSSSYSSGSNPSSSSANMRKVLADLEPVHPGSKFVLQSFITIGSQHAGFNPSGGMGLERIVSGGARLFRGIFWKFVRVGRREGREMSHLDHFRCHLALAEHVPYDITTLQGSLLPLFKNVAFYAAMHDQIAPPP